MISRNNIINGSQGEFEPCFHLAEKQVICNAFLTINNNNNKQ